MGLPRTYGHSVGRCPKIERLHFKTCDHTGKPAEVPPLGSWSRVISHRPHLGDDFDVAAPQRCCRLCQREPRYGNTLGLGV